MFKRILIVMLFFLPEMLHAEPVKITCNSKLGERIACAADTSKGVVLLNSHGEAACLLGKTWGYDSSGVWVSDGCSADFLVAQKAEEEVQVKKKSPEYVPNVGF